MDKFRDEIYSSLKKVVKGEIKLEKPPKPEMGDYAFPCFGLAKEYKKNPIEIALQLATKVKKGKNIEKIKAIGPYLNFFIKKGNLADEILPIISNLKGKYGSSRIGKDEKLTLEHTSINPNASPHLGRARNALIGDSLARVLRFAGYKVKVHYFINDIGKQIAMLVLAAKGRKDIVFKDLLRIYMDIAAKVEVDKAMEKKVFNLLFKLEKNDKKVISEFKRIVDISLKGQIKILSELGIKYDSFDYESEYLFSKKTAKTLKLLEKTGRFYFDKDNRFVLDEKGFGLGMKVPVLVLTRGDGTSLYALRDISYALDISQKGRNILVLGEDQKLYSEQINSALKLLGMKTRDAIFYSFVLLEDGKMSTRKGNVVLLEDFMLELHKKAVIELNNRYGKFDDDSAKAIGYSALKFGILKVSPEKNVTFNLEQALNFEGETGPYVQYAYARICSIVSKNDNTIPKTADFSCLDSEVENVIIRKLSDFPALVEKAAIELRPNILANYAYELAKQFNEFYHLHNILKAEENTKEARLILINCVRHTLKNSLSLLGIDVLEKM
jgi:arginyl-tRNA synthetase